MKRIFQFKVGLLFLLFLIGGCKTDIGSYVRINDDSNPVLNEGSTALYTLLEENAADVAETFEWTNANFGYQAAVEYDVQMDFAGNAFAKPVSIGTTSTNILAVTVAELNDAAGLLGIPFETLTDVEIRVVADPQGDGSTEVPITSLSSNANSVQVQSYEVVINYPKIYVPGDYQAVTYGGDNWNPAKEETTLESLNSDGNYEGYLYFVGATTILKFVDAPNWDGDTRGHGTQTDDGISGSGVIDPSGDNIPFSGSAYYKFNLDWENNTYEFLRTSWAIIGDATPNGWDDPDTDMTFNQATQLWTWEGTLTNGAMKFRANDDWALNYGVGNKAGQLSEGAGDIPVSAGSYIITLDLNQLPYRYTITEMEGQ